MGNKPAKNVGDGVPICEKLLQRIKGLQESQKQIKVLDQYKILVNERIEIEIVKKDLTQETTDAVTNAANSQLRHGGGLAAAIRKKAGEKWDQESHEYVKKNGPILTGAAGVTSAGDLPSKYVIHTVGPIYKNYTPDMSNRLL